MTNSTTDTSVRGPGSTTEPSAKVEVVRDATFPTAIWSNWSCLVRLVVTDPTALLPAAAQLEAMMARVEGAASRFQIDSELNWANANAGRPVAISRTLVNLVDTALGEASRSSGAVDPTIGRDLVRIGYDRDIHLIGDSHEAVPDAPQGRPTWRDVKLDRFAGLLTVPAGCALDLGASAKARTADWAAADLHDRFGCDVLVEIGGDLAVAGRKRDWQVTVAERGGELGPHSQQVSLSSGGMATSTTTIRRWQRADAEINHIIDPVSGNTAGGPWRTVTVAAASATHANTCSTAAIVLGHNALAWVRGQGVAARLIDRSGEIVTVGGWPC
jgi:thiamine biosynthesis lipoprotein